MEEDQEQGHIKHVCKFCNKSFPCGRSLGGHMRSHHITNFSAENEKMKKLSSEEASSSGYGLRENPKKTWRLTDSSEEKETSLVVVLDKVCKECGKGFQSWKALFGHMKCHSDKEKVILNDDHDYQEDSCNKVVMNDSQSDDDDDDEVNVPNRRRRRRRRRRSKRKRTRYMKTNSVNSSSVSVSEIQYEHEYEQEQVAISLMMLSRDVSNWCGLNSLHLEKTVSKIEGKRIISNCSEIAKLVKPRDKNNKCKIDSESAFEVNGEELVVKKSNLSEKSNKSHKKGKFECTTCNKIFQSYQALGGHRAGHKRNKGCFFAATKNENSESSEVIMKNIEKDNIENVKEEEDEELVGELESQSQSVMVEESLPEIKNFLDLNLPATTTDEENNGGHQYGENYKPWWLVGSNHKQEGLLGLLTN